VRPQPQPDVRTVVTEDAALRQLLLDVLEVGRPDDDGAAAPPWIPRASYLEAGLVQELDQE
jgi:hypothetical protein